MQIPYFMKNKKKQGKKKFGYQKTEESFGVSTRKFEQNWFAFKEKNEMQYD